MHGSYPRLLAGKEKRMVGIAIFLAGKDSEDEDIPNLLRRELKRGDGRPDSACGQGNCHW